MTSRNCTDQSITNFFDHRWSPEPDHQLSELESERARLVQTVIDIRARLEQAEDAGSRQQAQRLLSAAVEDLARHDALESADAAETAESRMSPEFGDAV